MTGFEMFEVCLVIHNGEHEGNMLIVRGVRLNEVDERDVHMVGQLLDTLHGGFVLFRLPALFGQVLVNPVPVHNLRSNLADPVSVVGVTVVQNGRELFVADITGQD